MIQLTVFMISLGYLIGLCCRTSTLALYTALLSIGVFAGGIVRLKRLRSSNPITVRQIVFLATLGCTMCFFGPIGTQIELLNSSRQPFAPSPTESQHAYRGIVNQMDKIFNTHIKNLPYPMRIGGFYVLWFWGALEARKWTIQSSLLMFFCIWVATRIAIKIGI